MDIQLLDKNNLRKVKGRNLMKRFLVDYDVPHCDLFISLPKTRPGASGLKRQKLGSDARSEAYRKSGSSMKKKCAVRREEKSVQTDFDETVELDVDLSNIMCKSNQTFDLRSQDAELDSCNGGIEPENQNANSSMNTTSLKGSNNFASQMGKKKDNVSSVCVLEELSHSRVSEVVTIPVIPVVGDDNGKVRGLAEDKVLVRPKPLQSDTCSVHNVEVTSTARGLIRGSSNIGFSIADSILDKYFPVGETKSEIQETPVYDKQVLKTPLRSCPQEPTWPSNGFKRFLSICSYIRSWNEHEKNLSRFSR